MGCGACVRRVEEWLGRVPDVAEAAVNLATEKASVLFDPALVDLPALAQAVERAGYEVRPEPPPAVRGAPPSGAGPDPDVAARRAEDLADLRLKALVALAAGLALMAAMFLPVHLDMTIAGP